MLFRPISALFQLPPIAQVWGIVFGLFGRYIFNDWQFLGFLMVFVVLDTVTGIIAAIIAHELSSRKFGRFASKLFIYSVLLIVTHGLTHFQIHSVLNFVYKAFDGITYTFLMGREAISILENLNKIDPELIPESISKRLQGAISSVPERLIDNFTAKPLEEAPTLTPEAAPVEAAEQPQTTITQ